MSLTIPPVHTPNTQTQTQPAAPPPKQTGAQNALPQDKVTISDSAKQAQTSNTKPAASGDVNHDGDSH